MKEDITAITYDIFKRYAISIKFKIKTYYEDHNNQEVFYHSEYVFNSGNKRNANISITPKGYIQFDIRDSDGNKKSFFMSEVFKNKFVRKVSQLASLLDAYDSNEIDIIKVDSSGTHISSNFPKSVKVLMGKSSIDINTIMREEKNDVCVELIFDGYISAVVTILDFLDIYYKLKDFNFLNTSLLLLNYLGCPTLGKHETDFREIGIIDNAYSNMVIADSNRPNPMRELDSIKEPRQSVYTNKKINW